MIIVLYGAMAMQIAREQGVDVAEVIDDVYILANDENYVPPGQRVLNAGLDIAGKFLDDGMNMAMEYLNEQENRKKIIEAGFKIAQVAIMVAKSR